MRISDWSSDVCSSDLAAVDERLPGLLAQRAIVGEGEDRVDGRPGVDDGIGAGRKAPLLGSGRGGGLHVFGNAGELRLGGGDIGALVRQHLLAEGREPLGELLVIGRQLLLLRFIEVGAARSEEHTSELQSLMRISYA